MTFRSENFGLIFALGHDVFESSRRLKRKRIFDLDKPTHKSDRRGPKPLRNRRRNPGQLGFCFFTTAKGAAMSVHDDFENRKRQISELGLPVRSVKVPHGTSNVVNLDPCSHFPIITLIPGYSTSSPRFLATCVNCRSELEATWKIKTS